MKTETVIKCPECGETFRDGENCFSYEGKILDSDKEYEQGIFKALRHFGEEHPEELESIPGVPNFESEEVEVEKDRPKLENRDLFIKGGVSA